MVKITNKALGESIDVERIIGRYKGSKKGPTTIFIGGAHGNETSSVFALDKIFKALERLKPDFRGEIVAAYAGNLEALKKHVRYVDTDINRIWIPDRLEKLGFLSEDDIPDEPHEFEERKVVDELIKSAVEGSEGDVYVFDLHTTSSVSPPFIAIADTVRNRKIAMHYPLPCVIGFDEEMHGTFMNYINELGLKGMAFEAGEHFSLAAVENNISFIWYTLYVTGCMDKEEIPHFDREYQRLSKATVEDQRFFDLRFTYTIQKEEKFQMKPGYVTFDKVKEGEILAENKDGDIKAPMTGRIFMPLYQQQGDDGFFILTEIEEEWLTTSEWLRRHDYDDYLPLIKGIEKHEDDQNTILINSEKLFYKYIGLLHLLGYRRHRRTDDDKIMVTRRVHDIDEPALKEAAYQE